MKELASNHTEWTESYSRTQSGLVKEVINIACKQPLIEQLEDCDLNPAIPATYTTVLESLDNVIAHLDVIVRCQRTSLSHQSMVLTRCTVLRMSQLMRQNNM